jgi:hypothetical protein
MGRPLAAAPRGACWASAAPLAPSAGATAALAAALQRNWRRETPKRGDPHAPQGQELAEPKLGRCAMGSSPLLVVLGDMLALAPPVIQRDTGWDSGPLALPTGSRLRSSQELAAHPDANFARDTSNFMILTWFLDLTFLYELGADW